MKPERQEGAGAEEHEPDDRGQVADDLDVEDGYADAR